MSIQPDHLVAVYSGGTNNSNPNYSLGGDPSAHPVVAGHNGLFPVVSGNKIKVPFEDYHCIYIFNNSENKTLYRPKISAVPLSNKTQIGFYMANEVQQIKFLGNPTSGSITFGYNDEQVVVPYSGDINLFNSNLSSLLNSQTSLSGASATSTVSNIVDISFSGADGLKYHPLIEIVSNNLNNGATILTTRIVSGGPVNSIASIITNSSKAPTGVVFSNNVVSLGNLAPGEGFPVWIKRHLEITSKGQVYSFSLKMSGDPFP